MGSERTQKKSFEAVKTSSQNAQLPTPKLEETYRKSVTSGEDLVKSIKQYLGDEESEVPMFA
jgi:hypothetical protein